MNIYSLVGYLELSYFTYALQTPGDGIIARFTGEYVWDQQG